MNTGLYARVSTTNHGQDTELQLKDMRDYCASRGWNTVEYVDEGVSGSKDSRPQLNRMMADAKARKLDVILCWKLDRFGRSLRHLVNSLAELEAVGVAFISLKDSIDLSTPAGRLMFGVIASMAEFERDLIRERVRAGIAHAKSKGRRFGRKAVVIDIARVKALRAEGQTIREIAGALGCSRTLIHNKLTA
jgi:putative DNA-invertase from lambdoid prophage Rac